ncbi:hypothetical protein N8T08_008503 [Aspergillus melleus]|uniref:Uncharacterized protein n=1 Tax=Aspergillus melleus TaxID=138277 RepID=A0ACC3BDZ6_9EURO|nr:hypothetical protein N8T08_008503 [Aspergillus melleus]
MASELRKDPGLEGDIHKESTDPQAVTAEDSQASDNEGGERPVRNKLKETSITSVPVPESSSTEQPQPQEGRTLSRDSSRGRKRSFDDEESGKSDGENGDDDEMDDAGHRRKRSRDSSYEEANANAALSKTEDGQQLGELKDAEALSRKILSPKKKRSRDQLDKDETKVEDSAKESASKTAVAAAENGAPTETSATEGEPEKKRHRDASQEREKAPVTSAFANTSTVSPFGSLGASSAKKEEEPKPAATTSSSAFASSTLAAFSGSEQSPFGSLGSSTPSVFKSSETAASKPAATGFAAAAGSSGFSALGSGFSGFGGGFGATKPKAGLTSFASPSVPTALSGSSKDKPFGAPADDEEEEDNKEEKVDSGPGEFEQDKTDERFFERPIETGEEEEKTYFSCKAKLFQFSDKEWRERGIGTFKVNVKVTDGKEDKKSTRLIMRADGVGRVMLNTPIFKGMTVGDAASNEPNSKHIHLASLESGRSVPILLRTGHEDHAKELYQVVCDLLNEQ